jgi:hypothetical protein
VSDIQNEIYEHLRLLGTHCGSLTALHGLSVIHLTDAMHEIKRLRSEVERLRLTPHECRQLYKAVFVLDQLSKNNDIDQEMWSTIRDMSARLGGGV